MSQDATTFMSEQNETDLLLRGLNPAQREAVVHKDGPMLVLAGPGSGKTRVVTHRVAWLLQNGVKDSQIAALTFTNKAAEEMKSRLKILAPSNRVWVGTFHRFCAFLLRRYSRHVGLDENYVIYDAEQSRKLLETVVPKNDLPEGVDVQKIASGISWAKNALVAASEYCARDGSMLGKSIEEAYPAYQAELRKANAVDFDDLLFDVVVLLQQNPEIRAQLDARFQYVLVDEYQDTNLVQYSIARALSIDYPNLEATGDPDQAIYGWRGADVKNILNFERDFPNAKVVRLEQNYRSVQSILRVADALIKHNVFRKDKNLFTKNKEGLPPRILVNLDQAEEAETIAAEISAEIMAGRRRPRDYAVFYRINALSRNLEYALKRYGVPYQLVRGQEFFNRKEVKDLCAYLQLVYNQNDVVAFKRVINTPARGIGRSTLARLEQFADSAATTLFDAARSAARIPGLTLKAQKSLVKFTTMIDRIRDALSDGADMEVALSLLLEETKYVEKLRSAVKTEDDEQHLANIQELLSEVREFDADFSEIEKANSQVPDSNIDEPPRDRLGAFLEQIALISDVDAWDSNDDRVSLMTLHAAKGLEFPVVYIIAIEDGILPHERSKDDKDRLEEERRLFFVGLTRAKEELRLSQTRFREFRGAYSPTFSSRFFFEFPKTGVDRFDSLDSWLASLKTNDADAPDSKPIIPRFFERKVGGSQRDALWRQSFSNFSSEEADQFSNRSVKNVGEKKSFQAHELRSGNADFADVVECVDPEPNDSYSQVAPDNVGASSYEEPTYGIDEESASLDYFDGDAVFDVNDDSPLPISSHSPSERKKKSGFAEKPKSIAPDALSTASRLETKFARRQDRFQRSVSPIPDDIDVNSFVQHKKYGVGVVKDIYGPSFDKIARISFLSGIGELELSLGDPNLSLVAVGKGKKRN